MNLAFGAGSDQKITSGRFGLAQSFDLKCFGKAVAACPRTVAAAKRRSAAILHFGKLLRVQAGNQLAG